MGKYLIKKKNKKGFNEVVPEGTEGLEIISFGILNLDAQETHSFNSGEKEVVLVLLDGRCDITVGDDAYYNLMRRGLFNEDATTVYIPRQKDVSVTAKAALQIAVVSAPTQQDRDVMFVQSAEVKENVVGKDNFTRRVVTLIGSESKADRLIVGETFSEGGNWSSYPPHKHDVDDPPEESQLEELYYFRVDPPKGFGFIRIYTDDRSIDEAYTVEDGDTVVIPRGYHPVAGAPGYKIYYLWVLAGEGRLLAPKDDPDFAWVK